MRARPLRTGMVGGPCLLHYMMFGTPILILVREVNAMCDLRYSLASESVGYLYACSSKFV